MGGKELFIYVDETTFRKGEEELIGCGMLVCDTLVPHSIIEDAIINLQKDPDFDIKRDSRTISKGYFHASQDSKNAHSHLCNAIKDNINCNFIYSYISKKGKNSSRSYEDLARLTFQIASTKFFDERYKIHVIVEKRQELTISAINKVLDNLYRNMEVMAYKMPSMINVFPDISFEIQDKESAGLQVADFILWAVNRSISDSTKDTWKEYLDLKLISSSVDADGSAWSGHYYINKDLMKYDRNQMINYPYKTPKDESAKGTVYDYYNFVEAIILYFSKDRIPKHAYFLNDVIANAQNSINKDKDNFQLKDLLLICSTFIRIFDTIPIYNEVDSKDKEKWENLLYAKKICGLVFVNNTISSGRTRDALLRHKWGTRF